MFTGNRRSAHSAVRVAFSRTGRQQFSKFYRKPGVRFLRALILQHELAQYLSAYEAAGIHLDTECQEVCYDRGIYLLLHKEQGIWYITDVFTVEEAEAFEPVYCWQRIRCDALRLPARILTGWRRLIRKAAGRE